MPDGSKADRSIAGQTVRVFISSTFRDMHAERDHLVTVVFPELRERVEQLGLEFFDVDLRWGVPAKDANGETANSWEYCRQWIDRVEPFFVCILGQRYGWVPRPEQLKALDDRQRQQAEERSITDMEVRHAVLNTRLSRRSYFYLRADEAPASASEFVDPPPLLRKLEELKGEIRSCGRPVRPYPCRWTSEGFAEMEQFGQLVLDDLWSGVLRDPRVVSKEVWRQALGADPDTDSVYTDESQPIPPELWDKIVDLAKPAPKEPLDAEREQMDAFAASRLRWFQGRTPELGQLTSFLDDSAADAPRLAVLAAVPGQGKSALLAKLHNQLKPSPYFVITHFVGATERSASAHALVERLLGELDRSGIAWPSEQQGQHEPKRDFNSLCQRLAHRLGDYAGERRIVILLDALNQLSDERDLQWLPTRLGPGVRVMASCVEDASKSSDSPEQRVLQALASRRPAPLRVALGPLTQEDVRTIVVAYLKEYCKVLDREQVDAICALPQARNPLYLVVMLGELRTLGGNDMNRIVGELIASMPLDHPDTVSLFRWVLQRLEVFGQEAVQWWCLYLAHGHVGMSSHELADLLARKLGPDAAATALLIERGLRRYLQRRSLQLDFFHGQLRQAVLQQYSAQVEVANVHSDIANYFRDLADPERNQSWKGNSPRPFLEVVFHLAGAQHLDELCETLCDLRFVEARCRHGQVFELIADYGLGQEHLAEAQENLRQERERQARLARWTEEITEYSRQWSERRDRLAQGEVVSKPEPRLPEPPVVCRMWTEEEIDAECQRIMENPTRLDRMQAFAGFVEQECYPLLEFGARPGFVVEDAMNDAPSGPVHDAARGLLPQCGAPQLLRRWPKEAAWNPKPAMLRTLEGHSDTIKSVSVTADGRRAVSGSADKTLKVWDLESGACVRTLEGHSEWVTSVSVTPDGRRAVSGSHDKTLRMWDLESGSCLLTLEGHSGWVTSVSVTPDGRLAVSGGWDKTLRVWDLSSGRCICTLEGHTENILSVCVTPDGRWAISGGWDRTLRVWDLESMRCLFSLEGHTGWIQGVCVTPDARYSVSASEDETLRVWDLRNRQCIKVFEDKEDVLVLGGVIQKRGGLNSVNITADGRLIGSGGWDYTVRVRDLNTGSLRILAGSSRIVEAVCLTPDGRHTVSGGYDMTVRVWDSDRRCSIQPLAEHHKSVESVCLTPNDKCALSASLDKTIRIWDLDSLRCLGVLEGHSDFIYSVCGTADGRRAVSGSWDHTIRLWDLERQRCIRVLEGPNNWVNSVHSVSLTPDGEIVVSASYEHCLRVWDLRNGQCIRTLEGHVDWIQEVIVLPDGRQVLSAGSGADKTIRLWELSTGRQLCTLGMDDEWISSMAVTFDGKYVIAGAKGKNDRGSSSGHNLIRVWNLEERKCVRVLEGHKDSVSAVCVAPDGRSAVTGSEDNTLRMWDLESGKCLAVFTNNSPFRSIALSKDGRRVVAGTSVGAVLFIEIHGLPSVVLPDGAGQNRAAQLSVQYVAARKAWDALPWQKRMRIPKPERPTGI